MCNHDCKNLVLKGVLQKMQIKRKTKQGLLKIFLHFKILKTLHLMRQFAINPPEKTEQNNKIQFLEKVVICINLAREELAQLEKLHVRFIEIFLMDRQM